MSNVLVVTGGSRGIGSAIAQMAASRGWRVCIGYRESAAAAELVVEAIRSNGGEAVAVAGDVAQERDAVRLFEEAEHRLGPIGGLVNNAAIIMVPSRVADLSVERWEATMSVNVRGSFLCAREAVRRMSTARGGVGGAIVNITSPAAIHGSPGEYVDYATSKGAVDSFTMGLAREVASEGIRVNAVRPGSIRTEMQAAAGDSNRAERLVPMVPLGRVGMPEEVAEAVCWLLSDSASYVVGTTIDVGGGYRG